MNRNLRLRPASLVATAVALVLAQSATAQEQGASAQDEPAALGEITVTARKRAESIQDVPFSISARTGEQLAAAGASNIEDVSRNIAGFTVLNLGPGQSQAAIRGVSGGKIDR
ncbi:MAG: TonB-dependent receptor plug domain-containing protein, partial [Pseudomonadota bacterium]|nr:TonB-dependent receptor plug domain-containing protein [Pseudomonadota bacterium]